jgi:pheromone shutdown-related protein TraB
MKLLSALLASAFTTEKLSEQEIENLKNRSELDGMMSELAEYLPSVKTTLIDERDRYLASKIWTSVYAGRIVAVIGAGHMQGIINHLEKLNSGEETAVVADLEAIPLPGFWSKAARFIIPVALVGLLAAGFFWRGTEIGVSMMLHWLLWNGSLAALGAIVALAHPLAIIVSFFGAPITTLSPFIGVGFFSGLIQAAFRKPQVSDVQNIMDDITNLKGWYRNRITRALLVFFFSSLGSSIGTFISVPAIASLLRG